MVIAECHGGSDTSANNVGTGHSTKLTSETSSLERDVATGANSCGVPARMKHVVECTAV